MKNDLKQRGITLIALIITIIVMLILVAVTISVALNGGLFNNAKDASDKTKRAVSKEELISAMVGEYDRRGNFIIDNVELPDGAMWCREEDEIYNPENEVEPTGEGDWVITEIGNKFYVTKDGTVLDEKPEIAEGRVYYLNSIQYQQEFYINENNVYTDFGEEIGFVFSEISGSDGTYKTIGNNNASKINTQLGEEVVTAETPICIAFGSLELVLINNEWYCYYGSQGVEKFELVNIDTSFLDTATPFGGF